MKKGILKLSALFISLFVGATYANATVTTTGESCTQIVPTSGSYNMSCNLKLIVDANATEYDPRVTINNGDEFEIIFQLQSGKDTFNIVNNEVKLIAAQGWTVDGQAEKTVNIKEDGSVSVVMKYTGDVAMGPETYTFAEAQYQKDDTAAEACGFAYGTPVPNLVCQIVSSNGVKRYFGLRGLLLGDESDVNAVNEYYKQCYSCKTSDEAADGKYHGLDGKETDKAGYERDCTNICKIEGDKYYCKDGQECDKAKYDEECDNPKTGSFIPYAGIVAGVLLIGVSTVLVRKQTKIKKI